MSQRNAPAPARLLFSVIYREEADFAKALRSIVDRIGEVACTSEPFPFDRTEYYWKEMGAPLVRRFVLGNDPVSREELATVKVWAETIESELSVGGKRTVNIDPGYLTDENVVLATGKNYSHRIYLREGVFADLTLVFEKGEYRPLPWTYPDYASPEVRAFLGELRRGYREAGKRAARGD
jgi:hypothetical protein